MSDIDFYLSLVTTLWPFSHVMIDQVEDGAKTWQVVSHARAAGIQPESSTRVMNSHASWTLVSLKAQGVQVPGIWRIAN